MPRKTPTSNPKWRSCKFAAGGEGVNSNDLQGLQAIRKVEVSRYNSVKNTVLLNMVTVHEVGAS
jgi:hypothetical protein